MNMGVKEKANIPKTAPEEEEEATSHVVSSVATAVGLSSNHHQSRPCKPKSTSTSTRTGTIFSNPSSWLLFTIADLDERMKTLSSKEEDKKAGDSFAERAEAYYLKRPQLLALLDDLYNDYLSLADRYCQALAKHSYHQHGSQSSLITKAHFEQHVECYEGEQESNDVDQLVDSDVESSLSYQPPTVGAMVEGDGMVAELVVKMVDYDILMDELSTAEGRWSEWSRKAELQRSLLEVLESERVVLLNENAMLGYKVVALAEENKGLAAETLFMKRKAAELARCMLKMREDRRVFVLSRKIEDLQGQIYSLQQERRRRNKEEDYYHHKRDCLFQHHQGAEKGKDTKSSKAGENRVKIVSKWWDRVKNLDLFLCSPLSN